MQSNSHPNYTRAALVSLTLAGLIAVFPFLVPHGGLALSFPHEWTAFALGAAACFPFLARGFWTDLNIPHSAICLLAFVAVIALQALVVDHAYVTQALLPGLYITWAALLVVLCAWIREQIGLDRAVTLLAWAILIGGAMHTMVGVAQHFDVHGHLVSLIDRKNSHDIYGNIGQRNHYATHITLAGFALTYLYATNRVNRALAITLSILFASVLAGSSSRAVAIYLAAGFLLSLASYRATRADVHHRMLQGTGALLLLLLLFQHLLPLFNDWLKLLLSALGIDATGVNTSVALERDVTEGIRARVLEWHKAWLMFLQSPLLGIGVGNYGWHSFNYQTQPEFAGTHQQGLFSHSHNLIMQVLAELGIVGVFLLALLAIKWVYDVLPFWKNPSHWLILILVTVLFLHSSVEYPLWYSYFLGIAAVLLGLSSHRAIKIKFTPSLGQMAAGVVLLFSGSMLFITFLGFQDVVYAARLAMRTSPLHASEMLRAVSKNALLTPWAELSMAIHERPNKNTISAQLELTTRLTQYRPNAANIYRQVTYLALAGKSAEASTLMKQALVVYPQNFTSSACSWRTAAAPEIRALWQAAEELTPQPIKCRQ